MKPVTVRLLKTLPLTDLGMHEVGGFVCRVHAPTGLRLSAWAICTPLEVQMRSFPCYRLLLPKDHALAIGR